MMKITGFNKAIFLNYSGLELQSQYWYRIDKVIKNKVLISANDPKLLIELKDADALFLKPVGDKINKEFINKAPKLKYIGMMGTGVGGIDTIYCKTKNIVVTNIKDYATEGVAEITFGWIFDQIRETERASQKVKEGDYTGSTFTGSEIKGKKFGVIGLGHIGCRIAEIAKAFGADVRYWSRNRKTEEEARLGIEYLSIKKLLSTSDFITLNLSLVPETNNFLDRERVNLIKKGVILINTSPMELINFEALVKKLAKKDMTFIFDHSDEVDEKRLRILKKYPNCIIQLPIGFSTKEATVTKQGIFINNIESYLNGSPNNVVNFDFRIIKTPLTGPGYEPATSSEREQWLQTRLRPYKKKDHKLILEQDIRIYPTSNSVSPTTIDNWYTRNPEFGMIYEIGNKTVGTCVIVPLNRQSWKDLVNGKIFESDLNQKSIFNNKKDSEIALHFYHMEKLFLTEKFYSRILLDLNNIIFNLRKTNPGLKIIGSSSLCTTSLALDLFQDRFNYQEKGYVSTEHIISKGRTIFIFDEKVGGKKKLEEKLKKGYSYHHRCKMLILYPEDFSLIWLYLKD